MPSALKSLMLSMDVKEFNVHLVIIAVLIANGSSKERSINFELRDFYGCAINTLLITSLHGSA